MEYRKYIEKDPALERRFQPIIVNEPTAEVAIEMVRALVILLCLRNSVNSLLRRIAKINRLIPGGTN